MEDSVNLLSVELWQFLLGHVVNKEIVSDLRISVNALTVSLCNSLGKYSGILGIKKQVDSGQLAVFFSSVPVACVDFTLGVVGMDEN